MSAARAGWTAQQRTCAPLARTITSCDSTRNPSISFQEILRVSRGLVTTTPDGPALTTGLMAPSQANANIIVEKMIAVKEYPLGKSPNTLRSPASQAIATTISRAAQKGFAPLRKLFSFTPAPIGAAVKGCGRKAARQSSISVHHQPWHRNPSGREAAGPRPTARMGPKSWQYCAKLFARLTCATKVAPIDAATQPPRGELAGVLRPSHVACAARGRTWEPSRSPKDAGQKPSPVSTRPVPSLARTRPPRGRAGQGSYRAGARGS